MLPTLDQYVSFLRDASVAGGFPMVVAGLGLMLFGWRLWRLCAMLAFGVIGFGAVFALLEPGANRYWFAACAGVVVAAVAFVTARHAVSVLGGLIVAGIVYAYLSTMNVEPYASAGLAGVGFIAGMGFALINRRRIVILVTAFLGAILLMSGLASWALAFPGFFDTMRYLAERSLIVIPFLLLVPTAMSCFYQIAEVRRCQAEL